MVNDKQTQTTRTNRFVSLLIVALIVQYTKFKLAFKYLACERKTFAHRRSGGRNVCRLQAIKYLAKFF